MAVTVDEYEDMTPLLEMLECEAEARRRYHQSNPYQADLAGRYKNALAYFDPPSINGGSGDQWPTDRIERPDKIHVTLNIIRPIVSSSARLEAMLPRITIPSSTLPAEARKKAEGTEQLMLTWLEMSGWDVWMYDLCLSKGIFGKGIIKTFWNKAEKRGDCIVIEQPQNLRIGWASNDYSSKDWALYEYKLSKAEIERRFPEVEVSETGDKNRPLDIRRRGDHTDPLGQKDIPSNLEAHQVTYRQESEYERHQIAVWDYWYRQDSDDDEQAGIYNVILVGGVCTKKPQRHPELADIPYIVIEHDHVPGTPEGANTVDDLIDLQIEMNRLFSHGLQYVADNVDPAWQVTGEDAAGLPDSIIPKAGEATNVGNSRIEEIPKGGANTFPITEMIGQAWNFAHRISGLPEIGLGGMAGSDVSGRATAIQVQSHMNRMDQRRNRLYAGIVSLLRSWVYMATRVNPRIEVGTDEEGNVLKVGVAELVQGMNRWKIIAPEITPRDASEQVTVELNKLNAKGQSLRTFMDNVGVENPEAEIDIIKQERVDAQLFPADAQAYLGIMTMLQQLQMTQQQMQQQMQAAGGAPAGPPGGAQAQAQTAVNQMQQAQYAAQPTGFEDQNQPTTQEGMPPPAEGQGPTGNTTLIRGGQALNQIAFGGG